MWHTDKTNTSAIVDNTESLLDSGFCTDTLKSSVSSSTGYVEDKVAALPPVKIGAPKTEEEEQPEAVLIRACIDAEGPGKLTKKLGITGSYNWANILTCPDLWIEDDGFRCTVETDKRVGIGYASQEDQNRLWRFKIGKPL